MKDDVAPLNHRLVAKLEDFCTEFGVDESNLGDHELYVSPDDLIKQKAAENLRVAIDAYKQVDDSYLVHMKEDVENNEFTFAGVPGSVLAKAMDVKEEDLRSQMNEDKFDTEQYDDGDEGTNLLI